MSQKGSQELVIPNGLWNNTLIPPQTNFLQPQQQQTQNNTTQIINQFPTPFLPTFTPTGYNSSGSNSNNSSPSTPSSINNNNNTPSQSFKYTLPHNLNKYIHSKSNSKSNTNTGGKIIQCPLPTHNPILNHQKQEEIAASKDKQLQDVQYIENLESKLNEQQQLIQSLLQQNQLLQQQLSQHKTQISMLSTQNNTLLTSYNTLQSQWKSTVLPTISSTANITPNITGSAVVVHGVTTQTNTCTNSARMTIDCSKWSVNDVIGWINKLENGKYGKYSYCFCLSNIDGKRLMDVTRMDLDKMGIKDNKEQTVLLQHIQALKCTLNDTAAVNVHVGGNTGDIEGQIDTE